MTLGSRHLTRSRWIRTSSRDCQREQSGLRWLLKTSAEAVIIEILPKNEMGGDPKRKLSGAIFDMLWLKRLPIVRGPTPEGPWPGEES